MEAELKTVQILDWTVECDPEATRATHANMTAGSPEQCRCNDCLNFMAGRHLAYPPDALRIFAELGIQPDRESNVGGSIRLSSDSYQYNGWFHFVGHLQGGPEPRELVAKISAGEDIGPGVVEKVVYQPLTEN